jgi:hypothetical protein
VLLGVEAEERRIHKRVPDRDDRQQDEECTADDAVDYGSVKPFGQRQPPVSPL